jgi:hypothetical protein
MLANYESDLSTLRLHHAAHRKPLHTLDHQSNLVKPISLLFLLPHHDSVLERPNDFLFHPASPVQVSIIPFSFNHNLTPDWPSLQQFLHVILISFPTEQLDSLFLQQLKPKHLEQQIKSLKWMLFEQHWLSVLLRQRLFKRSEQGVESIGFGFC